MASITICVGRGKRIVVVYVAVRAGHHLARRRKLMRPSQWPSRGAVIECRCRPRNCVVAGRTIRCRERCPSARVGRVIRRLPRGEVASGISAVRRLNRQCVIVVDVALRTRCNLTGRRHLVRIRQREARRAVVKLPVQPADHVVARRAL